MGKNTCLLFRFYAITILLLTSVALRAQVNTSISEQYVKKIIISVPLKQENPERIIDRKREIDISSNYFSYISEQAASEIWPKDMDLDSFGNILVNDPANNRIQKYDKEGNYIGFISILKSCVLVQTGNGIWAKSYKSHFAYAPDGYIYVYDEITGMIEKYDFNGLKIGDEILDRQYKDYFKAKNIHLSDYPYLNIQSKTKFPLITTKRINKKKFEIKSPLIKYNIESLHEISGFHFVGVDKFGNMFFYLRVKEKHFITYIEKYNEKGIKVSSFRVSDLEGRYITPSRVILDEDGGYYELRVDAYNAKRLMVIRWMKDK